MYVPGLVNCCVESCVGPHADQDYWLLYALEANQIVASNLDIVEWLTA
jgi:hypothetical protein